MKLFHWIHHLFNPHCVECTYEFEKKEVCQSCETLKMQLAIVNAEKQRMLDALLEKPKPVEQYKPPVDLRQVQAKNMTWSVRKQMLEAEDREAAALLRKKAAEEKSFANMKSPNPVTPSEMNNLAQSIEELEKELGVEETDAQPSNLHR
jgi:hypothetical protein